MSQRKWCANGTPAQIFAKLLLLYTHVRNDLTKAHLLVLPVTFSCASKHDSESLRDASAILHFNLEPSEGVLENS